MEQNSGSTESVWLESGSFATEQIIPDGPFDVCIIGAGISGLSCAYHLVTEGLKVLVLDDGPIAGGETCRTTAHLASAIDDRFTEMIRIHGEEGARLAYQSHALAIDRIEQIVQAENIDCGFRRLDGYLFKGETTEDILPDEFEAARTAGVEGVQYPYASPVASLTDRPCIQFPRQGQFDPIKYLAALARIISEKGGVLATGHLVTHVKEHGDQVKVTLQSGNELTFPQVICATNSPLVTLTVHMRQAPYRTYAIAVEVPAGSVPLALYWDTEDPYHYIRLAPGSDYNDSSTDLLIVGGEDHKTGQDKHPGDNFERLYLWTKKRFPQAGIIRNQWSGQVQEPADGVAFIGHAPGMKHIYMVTGDSGMGMTHGTFSGMLITDLIMGRQNKFAKLYDPIRTSLRAVKDMAVENLTAFHQLGKHLTPGEVKSRDDIKPGSGAVVRHGLKKVATYRDSLGNFHERSATCTHMGCIVEWNDLEKSWDCPCHGSRFSPEGKVLNGPASDPLSPAGADKEQN